MPNNIHVSYDLHTPGKNYDRLAVAIKDLSPIWAKLHYSFWFVSTNLSVEEVFDRLEPLLDENDTLYIVDTSSNNACWVGLKADVTKFLQQNWNF